MPLHKKRQYVKVFVSRSFTAGKYTLTGVLTVCVCAVSFTRVGRGIWVHSPNLDQLTVSDDCLGRKSKKCDEKKTEVGLDESTFVLTNASVMHPRTHSPPHTEDACECKCFSCTYNVENRALTCISFLQGI